DGDSLILYLNGVQRGAIALSGNLLNVTTESLSIGADFNGSNEFFGTIDEVRLSSIARQEWEFNVDRSRMLVDHEPIGFGKVIVGESRKRTFKIQSLGSDTLNIIGISTTHNRVSVSSTAGFKLASGQDTTLWITFSPDQSMTLNGEAALVIASSDPTYPFISIPLQGSGVHTLPAGSYSTDPFTLALYHFEEIEETTVFDSSGNAMDAELFNSVFADSENGKFGQYLIFETVDQYCAVEPVEDPNIGPILGGFTAETWIRMRQLPDLEGTLMRRGNSEINQFSIVMDTSARVLARIWDENNELVELNSFEIDPLVLHQWYHIAFTYDQFDGTVQLYVNGNEVANAVLAQPMMGSTDSHAIHETVLYIGGDATETHPFNGFIDEVRLSSTPRQVWEFNVNLSRSNIYPTWIDFGKVFIEASQDESFWVSNPGMETLVVSDITIDSEHDDYFVINPLAFSLSPGQVQQVKVIYSPEVVGTHVADLELQSNNLFPDQKIHLQGVCIDSSFSGPYDWDNHTLSLVHFEQSADTNLITGGGVSWSDTMRFGNSSLRLKKGWVNIPIDTSIDLSQQRFTIETWFSLAQLPTTRWTLLYWGYGNQWIQFVIDPQDNKGLQAHLSNSNGHITTLAGKPLSQLRTNYWYHFALAWSGDTLKLYINNTLYATSLFSGSLVIPSGQPIRMGSLYADETFSFQGWIDEFRLSSKERKPWEYNVVSPLISLSTRQMDFATVEYGQSRVLPFSMTNLGDKDLIVHSIQIGDEAFLMSGITLPVTISRMEYIAGQIEFTPITPDTIHESTTTILSNDTTVTSSIIALRGKSVGQTRNEEFSVTDPFTVALYHFNHDFSDTTQLDTVLYDPTGAGRNGVVYGATWQTAGLYREALHFNGLNNWVEIPSADEWIFDMASEAFTIEFSMVTDTVKAYQTLLFKGVRDTVHYGMYLDGNGQIAVHGFGSGGPRLNDGLWHQIAFIYNPTGSSKLYVDGVLVLSKAWINIEGADVGRPLMFGASASNSGKIERFFQGTIDEFRLSNVARAGWEVAPSNYGIQVATLNESNLTTSDTLHLSIYPPASLGIDSLFVYYREGGGLYPYSKLAANAYNDTFYVNIYTDSISLKGIEYYVDARTHSGVQFSAPSYAPVYNPYSISVYHHGLTDNLTYYTQEVESPNSNMITFQNATLFSIPTQLTEVKADSILKDLFPYNPYKWRLYWWHSYRSQAKLDSGLSEVYFEYPPPTIYPEYFHMYPGRAFWIVSKEEQSFQLPTGFSIQTDKAFEIELNPGWNMFGSPFWFPVAWDDCSISGTNLINTIYAWEGEEGYNSDISQLNPWIGYWIFNPDTVIAFLTIPPKESIPVVSTAPKNTASYKRHIAYEMQDSEWMIKLAVESGSSADRFNYAGIRTDANIGLDSFDQIEPPPSLGRQVSLNFIQAPNTNLPGLLASDIRPMGQEGQIWHLEVKGCKKDQSFKINWSWLNTLPEKWECYLIDLEDGNSVNCREAETIVRTIRKTGNSGYQFKLIAGTSEFVDENRDGISLVPIEFALHQNYPNPFNPETTIRYSLPRASKVDIMIFNVLGQKVRTYYEDQAAAGHFQIIWDATNDYAVQVSSGVYFYQIRTEDHIANRKMVVIR
ncbi:choice-of-anchor D domain-containing protein, partial [candidate division KSB1 bacterium]|nr:choice-of-anchor D domain-containing protein [candidate division KSB1 bacterium]